jgi:hypothetical protein
LAQRNYGFEKRQKELARKQTKEEKKRQRALDRIQNPGDGVIDTPLDGPYVPPEDEPQEPAEPAAPAE